MMAISTQGISSVDMTQSAKPKGKDNSEKTDAFSSLMDLARAGATGNGQTGKEFAKDDKGITSVAASNTKQDTKKTNEYETESKQPVKEDKPAETKPADSPKAKETKGTEKTEQVNTTDEAPAEVEIPADLAEAIASAINDLVAKILDTDPEELDSLLEENGLTLSDLLNPDTLKQFVLKAQDKTEIDLLVDEPLADSVNTLLSDMEQLVQDFEIEDPQAFEKALAALQSETAPEVTPEVATPGDFEKEPTAFEKEPVLENAIQEKPVQKEETPVRDYTRETQTVETVVEETKVTITTDNAGTEYKGSEKNAEDDAKGLINNLNQAINNVDASQTEGVEQAPEVSQAEILKQVIDEVKTNVTREVRSLEVVLNPEQLGKVHITVENRDGVMQARIVAETEAARNAIENGIQTLRETFDNQGLKVDAVEVAVGNFDFFNRDAGAEENAGSDQAKSRNGGGGQAGNSESTEEVKENDDAVSRAQGSSVSYTA